MFKMKWRVKMLKELISGGKQTNHRSSGNPAKNALYTMQARLNEIDRSYSFDASPDELFATKKPITEAIKAERQELIRKITNCSQTIARYEDRRFYLTHFIFWSWLFSSD